jgi:hypothetical protein
MRFARLIAGLLMVLPVGPVVAAGDHSPDSGKWEMLYGAPPWTVSRLGAMCDARVLTADRLFQLAAVKEGAVVYIAGKEWAFAHHEAMVHIVAGEGSGVSMTAIYEGYAVKTGGNAEAVYLLMGMLGENVETLNVKDDHLKTIASFPVTGMTKALEVWKACADKL